MHSPLPGLGVCFLIGPRFLPTHPSNRPMCGSCWDYCFGLPAHPSMSMPGDFEPLEPVDRTLSPFNVDYDRPPAPWAPFVASSDRRHVARADTRPRLWLPDGRLIRFSPSAGLRIFTSVNRRVSSAWTGSDPPCKVPASIHTTRGSGWKPSQTPRSSQTWQTRVSRSRTGRERLGTAALPEAKPWNPPVFLQASLD